MAQADLTSFIPLSLLFVVTHFLPIMVENTWIDQGGRDWFSFISAANLRRSSS